MKRESTRLGGLGRARRCLALLTLVVFGHAVALHAFHGHRLPATSHSHASAVATSTPQDAPASATHSAQHCPACHVQQGFAFLEAPPAILATAATAPVAPELSAPPAGRRIAEGSAPSRAPPAL